MKRKYIPHFESITSLKQIKENKEFDIQKEKLVNRLIKQFEKDIENGDVTVIEGFLQKCKVKAVEAFIDSEKLVKELSKSKIVDLAIEQIKSDFKNGDETAIEELINSAPIDLIIASFPDEEIMKLPKYWNDYKKQYGKISESKIVVIEKKGDITFYENDKGDLFQKSAEFDLKVKDGNISYRTIKKCGECTIKYELNGSSGYSVWQNDKNLEDNIWTLKEAEKVCDELCTKKTNETSTYYNDIKDKYGYDIEDRQKNYPVKTMSVKDKDLLEDFPNFSKTGSITGMKKQYYGKNALLVRCGAYIYNVTSKPEIYFDKAD
jgi:hypothetical protein